jgi:hypothetical protein
VLACVRSLNGDPEHDPASLRATAAEEVASPAA